MQVSAEEFGVVGKLDQAKTTEILSSMFSTVREARHDLELESRGRGKNGGAASPTTEGAHTGAVKSLTKRRLKAMVGQLIERKKAEAVGSSEGR